MTLEAIARELLVRETLSRAELDAIIRAVAPEDRRAQRRDREASNA
jgi:hypothetical protein